MAQLVLHNLSSDSIEWIILPSYLYVNLVKTNIKRESVSAGLGGLRNSGELRVSGYIYCNNSILWSNGALRGGKVPFSDVLPRSGHRGVHYSPKSLPVDFSKSKEGDSRVMKYFNKNPKSPNNFAQRRDWALLVRAQGGRSASKTWWGVSLQDHVTLLQISEYGGRVPGREGCLYCEVHLYPSCSRVPIWHSVAVWDRCVSFRKIRHWYLVCGRDEMSGSYSVVRAEKSPDATLRLIDWLIHPLLGSLGPKGLKE